MCADYGIEVGIMPAYEYQCKDCKKNFMIFLSIKEFEEKQRLSVLTVRRIM